MSNPLWPQGLQHSRLPYLSVSPGICSDSCPSSRWYHLTISSSVIPFSSCLQSLPTSGSFPMSQFFALGGQSIGASASELVLPMNIQDWFLLGLSDWISCCPRDSQEFSLALQFKSVSLQYSTFFKELSKFSLIFYNTMKRWMKQGKSEGMGWKVGGWCLSFTVYIHIEIDLFCP